MRCKAEDEGVVLLLAVSDHVADPAGVRQAPSDPRGVPLHESLATS